MKSKNQTPLGFLMGLLGVSLADLGDYLYVAQTSISKWKTGARTLKPDSNHFTGTVEYFVMLTRDPARREKLTSLFGRLYPDMAHSTPEELTQCVHTFLCGKLMPTTELQQAIVDEGRLYTAQIDAYSGDVGVQSALARLVAAALAKENAVLSVICRHPVDILEKFLPALMEGNSMRLLMDAPAANALTGSLSAMLAHPSVEARILPEAAAFSPHTSLALAAGEMLASGSHWPGRATQCTLQTDALALEQAQCVFDNLWQHTPPLFSPLHADQLSATFYRDVIETTLDTRMDWLVPSLPYLTMSRELLMEVLRANGVSGRVWTRVLGGCDALLHTAHRLYIPAGTLQKPPYTLPILSALCGRTIRMTTAQSKRHMLDAAALLRAGSGRLSVVPVQGRPEAVWQDVISFAKRNAFGGYLHLQSGAIRYATSPQAVSLFMAALDNFAARATPETLEPGYVAGLIESAALRV